VMDGSNKMHFCTLMERYGLGEFLVLKTCNDHLAIGRISLFPLWPYAALGRTLFPPHMTTLFMRVPNESKKKKKITFMSKNIFSR